VSFLQSVRGSLGSSGIYIALAAIVVLFTILTDGVLLSPDNLSRLLGQFGYILILAIGMVMIMVIAMVMMRFVTVFMRMVMIMRHMAVFLAVFVTMFLVLMNGLVGVHFV
jgi:ABC-type xylose transport system permease subunit